MSHIFDVSTQSEGSASARRLRRGAVGAAIACCCLAIAVAGLSASRRVDRGALAQVLWYPARDRGMTARERAAVARSKELARGVRREAERNPSLVQRFMNAYDSARLNMVQEYDYRIKPWAVAHGLKGSPRGRAAELTQLKVVMSECVKCVSECPAYVKHPIQASTFEDFSRAAKDECGMCFHAVAGPCPANEDNHGVLRVAGRGVTSLHSAGKPRLMHGHATNMEKASPREMGTNIVFLGHAEKAATQMLDMRTQDRLSGQPNLDAVD